MKGQKMQNRNYEKERMERIAKLLTMPSTEKELQEAKQQKEEKERRAFEKSELRKAKEKAIIKYERFMKLENNISEVGVTQILIIRDEIYINTWNNYVNADLILKYHHVKYDENSYIYGCSFDNRYRRLTQKEIKEILEESYNDYLDGHPFKDLLL